MNRLPLPASRAGWLQTAWRAYGLGTVPVSASTDPGLAALSPLLRSVQAGTRYRTGASAC
jgi:hypothetical protein